MSFALSLNSFAKEPTAKTTSTSVAVSEMSVEQLKARVAQLEADLVSYKRLKEENKRLRRQLRKIRMQMYDDGEIEAPKKRIVKEKQRPVKIKPKVKKEIVDEDVEEIEDAEEENREPETFIEWLTR